VAVVFLSKLENGETKQEGLCLKCARELGIKPVDDIISKMGISDDDIENMSGEIEDMMGDNGIMQMYSPGDEEDAEGRAPAIDFPQIIRGSADGQRSRSENDKKGGKGKAEKGRKYLTQYCTDITAKARNGELDRVIGRDKELDRVIQILCRRQKNNPCLIGEPGVGKTAIAEALALRIVDGKVPYKLKKCEIFLVDLTALVAGTQFRGQFETRVLGLLNEVKAAGNIILVIDEVHSIVGVGDAEGSMNAANIMKPALSRGEIQVIGATTLTEYRKYIEKDSALERRFQPVTVDEPSVNDTVEILRGIKGYYEKFHGIKIPDSVLRSAVALSERFITDRYLPDKAIDLLDEASSRISLSSPEINEKLAGLDRVAELEKSRVELESRIENVEDENKDALYQSLADVKVELLRLGKRIDELKPLCDSVEMTVADLADVIEVWTGIPAASISEDEFSRLAGLEERLKKRVIGQDEAVSAVARAVRRGRTGVSAVRRPVSFIFAGPTGVGKTHLVKVLSEDLFDSPETLIRLDMSEYMEKFSVSRIIGSPPGYVGYDDAGQLTEKIRRRPYSVVLFDEIEKAHPDVMNILLQILDEGRITDSQGRQVNFENTIIVMTTNAGSGGASSAVGFNGSKASADSDRTMKALEGFLRPEFINRVDEIITFRSLEKEDFVKIAAIMMNELKSALADKDIALTWSDSTLSLIADKSYSAKFGARNMRRYIQRNVEDTVATAIIDAGGRVSAIELNAGENEVTCSIIS
jgi:ATP-dependent Clp protease ATP-binding subunit ClpA